MVTAKYEKLEQINDPTRIDYFVHLPKPQASNLGPVTEWLLDQRGLKMESCGNGRLSHASQMYARMPQSGAIVGIDFGRPEDGRAKLTKWADGRPEFVYLLSLVSEDIIANECAYKGYCLPKESYKAAIELAGPAFQVQKTKITYTLSDAKSFKGFAPDYKIYTLKLPFEDKTDVRGNQVQLGCGAVAISVRERLGIKNAEELREFSRHKKPRVGSTWRFDDLAEMWLDAHLGDGKYLLIRDKSSGTASLPKGLYGSPESDANTDVVPEFTQTGNTFKERKLVVIDEIMKSRPVIITNGVKKDIVKEFLGELIEEEITWQ
ncbi:MAG: hypothetical protein V1731_00285 [Candidatus Aenigmatarchaeota archaeon]